MRCLGPRGHPQNARSKSQGFTTSPLRQGLPGTPWFIFCGSVVKDDVVNAQVGLGIDVKLNIINPLIRGEWSAGAIGAARLGHVDRGGLPFALGKVLQKQMAVVVFAEAVNLHAQCENVRNLPEVCDASRKSSIQVHGWVFDLKTGRIVDLNVDSNR